MPPFIVCLSVCLPGYGFYRPQVTLFDPGWRGEQTKGPEDSEWGVVDLGNDPTTIVERFFLLLVSHHTSCPSVCCSCHTTHHAHLSAALVTSYIMFICLL